VFWTACSRERVAARVWPVLCRAVEWSINIYNFKSAFCISSHMSDSKISNYFTPVTSTKKRFRSNSSPETSDCLEVITMDSEKVGHLTRGQLMTDITSVLSKLLDQKLSTLATKEDIGQVSEKITILENENTHLRAEISRLRDQEKVMLNKLVDLEGRSRRNNLIFKGLKWSGNSPEFREVVRQFCINELGCGSDIWVNRAHILGRNRNLVIAHLPQDADIDYIMTHTYMAREKGVVIFRDFPVEVRRKRACLSAVRQEVERLVGRSRMPIIHDHLIINGTRFTWEEDGLRAGNSDGVKMLCELTKHDLTDFIQKLRSRGPRSGRSDDDRGQEEVAGTKGDGTGGSGPGLEPATGGGGAMLEPGTGGTATAR
jgi:hypothetical protein